MSTKGSLKISHFPQFASKNFRVAGALQWRRDHEQQGAVPAVSVIGRLFPTGQNLRCQTKDQSRKGCWVHQTSECLIVSQFLSSSDVG